MGALIPQNGNASSLARAGGAVCFVSVMKLTLREECQDDLPYHKANARRKLR